MPSSAVPHRQSWTKNLAQLPIFKQVIGCLWLTLYIVTLLSLLSYDWRDLASNTSSPNTPPLNWIGDVGAGLGGFLYLIFGFGAFFFPVLCIWCCVINFLAFEIKWLWKPLWLALFLVSGCSLLQLQHLGGWQYIQTKTDYGNPGGLIGEAIIRMTVPYALGSVGAGILFIALFGISSIYLFSINPISTVLNAFSWYREWKITREEDRLAQAPPEEQLEIQKQRVRKKIEELQRKAAMEPLPEIVEEEDEEPEPVRRAQIRRPDDEDEEEVDEVKPATPIVEPRRRANSKNKQARHTRGQTVRPRTLRCLARLHAALAPAP